MKRQALLIGLVPVLLACLAIGCVRLKTDPIEVNVNVRLKVDRELNEFFGDLDAKDPSIVGKKGETS